MRAAARRGPGKPGPYRALPPPDTTANPVGAGLAPPDAGTVWSHGRGRQCAGSERRPEP